MSESSSPSRGADRRCFERVPCNAVVVLTRGDFELRGKLLDISLKGALVALDDSAGLGVDDRVTLRIELATEIAGIRMIANCAHVAPERVGVRWERMDLESFWHLRRLIELNAAAGRMGESELAALLDAGSRRAAG